MNKNITNNMGASLSKILPATTIHYLLCATHKHVGGVTERNTHVKIVVKKGEQNVVKDSPKLTTHN